ncbi:MAG TPA: hypothetical protein VLA38_10205, partial [Steroidobacteraceae bacterium]|nr:hypothetical protein [Steroidobacteraceae bacterium]
ITQVAASSAGAANVRVGSQKCGFASCPALPHNIGPFQTDTRQLADCGGGETGTLHEPARVPVQTTLL